MARKLRNFEYLTIQGWMINKLNLKGIELILFAALFNYAQDGTILEWAWVDDIRGWLISIRGLDLSCDEIKTYIEALEKKGYVNTCEEGVSVVRHIKELAD